MTPLGTRANPRSPIVVVVAVLGVSLFVALLVLTTVFDDGVDPTASSSFALSLRNDTSRSVAVARCDGRCDAFADRHALAPGQSVRVNASSEDVPTWWAVLDGAGRRSGCLPLRYGHAIDGLVVGVSEHAACPAGSIHHSDVAGAVLAFALVFAVAGIGLASVAFATLATLSSVRRRGLGGATAALVTALAGLIAFLGGWIVFDLYVVLSEGAGLLRRAAPAG